MFFVRGLDNVSVGTMGCVGFYAIFGIIGSDHDDFGGEIPTLDLLQQVKSVFCAQMDVQKQVIRNSFIQQRAQLCAILRRSGTRIPFLFQYFLQCLPHKGDIVALFFHLLTALTVTSISTASISWVIWCFLHSV